MVKINKIKPQQVAVFAPDGTALGFVNEYEFNDIRLQIKRNNLEGYFCLYKTHIIKIDANGRCDKWLPGFFDLAENQLSKLM